MLQLCPFRVFDFRQRCGGAVVDVHQLFLQRMQSRVHAALCRLACCLQLGLLQTLGSHTNARRNSKPGAGGERATLWEVVATSHAPLPHQLIQACVDASLCGVQA